MEKQQDLISVIVPVYHIKEYLERCVDSILAQSFTNLEILLVDDGSCDGTEELVDKLSGKDRRIRVFHKENGGSSSARNLGIREARGRYLGFVDSDDYIEPFMYERLYRAMRETGMPIAQGGRREIDEQGELLPDICVPPDSQTVYDGEAFMRELLLHSGDCSFCTKLTDASLFEGRIFPEGKLNEDFHVLVQMLPEIAGIVSVPERIYNVFYKSGSNTRTDSAQKFSRVYGDNVDNADMVTGLVKEYYPELTKTALRFGLYQRLDYMLHIPIAEMKKSNGQYNSIAGYLKKNRGEIRENSELTKKQKIYLLLFSVMPVLTRKAHRFIKTESFLDILAQKTVFLFLTGISGAFCLYAWKYTQWFKGYEEEYLENYLDSKQGNIIWLLGTIVLFILLSKIFLWTGKEAEWKKKQKIQKERLYILLGVVCLYYFTGAVFWVNTSHSVPYGDQLSVVQCAAAFQEGVFEPLFSGGYIDIWPHQLGLALVLEALFKLFGQGNYQAFQYLNACFMPLLVFAGFQVTRHLFGRKEACLYYLLLMTGCFQLFLYVPYVYGETGSISLMLTAAWCLSEYMKKQEDASGWLAGCMVSSAISMLLRKNCLIFVIAECLVLLVLAIRERRLRTLGALFLLGGCCLLCSVGVKKSYEVRADYEIGGGVPPMAYIAMGQQDAWPGPGWYNNYNKECYQIAGFDTEAASVIAKEYLRVRLLAYRENSSAAVEFIKQKLLTQWNEPTYEAFWVNESFAPEILDSANGEVMEKNLTREVFYGKLGQKLTDFMDRYQFIVYGMTAVAAACLFLRKRKTEELLLPAAVIGGFLFSILWEAKSRYILPYFVFMIIYSAYGIYCIHRGWQILWNIKNREKHGERKKAA